MSYELDNCLKTDDYQVLKNNLENYKTILCKEMYDYLEAILNLELSIINKKITDEERTVLSELSIYKPLTKYNIYNHTLKLLERNNVKLKLYNDYSARIIKLSAEKQLSASPRKIDIFDAVINKNNEVEVYLYNSKSDDRVKQKEIIKLEKKICEIKESLNTDSRLNIHFLPYIYDASVFYYKQDDREEYLEKYEKALKKINSRGKLTKNDMEEIELANSFYKLFMNEYGLDDSDFKLDTTDYILGFSHASHKYMNKKKVKIMPNIKIVSNNYYL